MAAMRRQMLEASDQAAAVISGFLRRHKHRASEQSCFRVHGLGLRGRRIPIRRP